MDATAFGELQVEPRDNVTANVIEVENWIGKLKEVIDNYSPDLIYFDGELGKLPDSLKLAFATYYLNHAAANNKEVVITHKNGELPKEVS